jgi:hypothetical protein
MRPGRNGAGLSRRAIMSEIDASLWHLGLRGGEKGHEIRFLRTNSPRIRTGNFLRAYRELNRAIREIFALIRECYSARTANPQAARLLANVSIQAALTIAQQARRHERHGRE